MGAREAWGLDWEPDSEGLTAVGKGRQADTSQLPHSESPMPAVPLSPFGASSLLSHEDR